ncbi:MAG: hypothetical protein WAM30_19725 [Candidatus Dormiibacterota bacterium]
MKSRDDDDGITARMLHDEIGGWSAAAGPNMHDVMVRAERAWQRPVMQMSTVGAFALAAVVVVAFAIVVLGPHFAFATNIRDALLAH